MTTYFVAPDGFDELCLWTGDPDLPTCVMRASSVHERFWPDVVARMTGTELETAWQQVKVLTESLEVVEGQRNRARAAATMTGTTITTDRIQRVIHEVLSGPDCAVDYSTGKALADAIVAIGSTDKDEAWGRADNEPFPQTNQDDTPARMTGTTITDDATVERVARALASSRTWTCFTAGCGANERDEEIHRGNFRHQAKAALAALTGVPHD